MVASGSGDDDDLVVAAQAGDRGALDALLRRHLEKVHALCLRVAGADDAADAMQEALIAIVRGLPRFDGRSRFGTWAYRVAMNACLDELRRRKRRPDPTELTEHDLEQGSFTPDVPTRLDVQDALRRLPLDYRAAVVLRDLCGLDYAEIAEALSIPIGTVRSRIARGRAALVPLLAGNPEDAGDRPTPRQ